MQILNEHQITQKIKRLAIEILEQNHTEKKIILAGINNNGMSFAQMIKDELEQVSKITFELVPVNLNPSNPLEGDIVYGVPEKELKGKCIVIVDDVANTGRTIFYACKPLMNTLPKKVEVAVLVDRMHKSFPVKVDYVGLSLATTLREDIEVQLMNVKEPAVYLR